MKFLIFFSLCLFSLSLSAGNIDSLRVISLNIPTEVLITNVLADSMSIAKQDKKIVEFLSFPLPLGIIGLHRIYMGAKPYVPLIYILTLGGCFGILPLIDFVVIVTHKDITPYRNDKVFMWLK